MMIVVHTSKTILKLLRPLFANLPCVFLLLVHLFSGNWISVIPGIGLQRAENVFHLGKSLFGCCINITLRKSTKTNITLFPTINELFYVETHFTSSSEY